MEPYTEEHLRETARVMGYGAVKYADLKSNRINNYIFSYDRMLDDKGERAHVMCLLRWRHFLSSCFGSCEGLKRASRDSY